MWTSKGNIQFIVGNKTIFFSHIFLDWRSRLAFYNLPLVVRGGFRHQTPDTSSPCTSRPCTSHNHGDVGSGDLPCSRCAAISMSCAHSAKCHWSAGRSNWWLVEHLLWPGAHLVLLLVLQPPLHQPGAGPAVLTGDLHQTPLQTRQLVEERILVGG